MIKAGVLGIDGCGAALLDAVRSCQAIELIALADRDGDLAKDRAAELHVEAYDDYRSLVVEQPIDAVFVAAPPFACHDQLRLAASRGIHVWRETPLARTVHEAATLLKAFEVGGVRLAVGRRWQFTCQIPDADELAELIGRPYAARGMSSEARSDPLGWRGDSDRAGGGALMDTAYEVVDAIVARMGLPDEVQAVTARRSGTQPYDTEDVASVTLRYQNGSMAAIVAHRRAGPPCWSLAFDGPKGSLILEPPIVIVRSPDGGELSASRSEFDSPYAPQVQAFARAVSTNAKTYASPARDHLATVAVIETAYLSARTGEPESTTQLYHLHDLPVPTPVVAEEEDQQETLSS